MKQGLCLVSVFVLFFPSLARGADLGVVGGGGFTGGDDQNTRGSSAVGASIGIPYAGGHRLQFDYLFNLYAKDAEKCHFVTGSYVIQGSAGRSRPFFQVGPGSFTRAFGAI